jgi:eukaryotic-like serine/threonine-protein kinase
MPGPATAEELLQLVERSQVADRSVVDKALASWRDKNSNDQSPATFAQHLMDVGVITPFHAEQLLAGRYKGFRVGAYRILRLIGVGGMGRVYLAEHAFMKRRVALKILPKSQHREGSAIERFQREAQAVAALNHPNIVHAYDSGQEGDVYFLAMEYVAGESVQDYVKQFGRVPWPYAADFIRQAAKGLQHAADNGLVHRDIKPGNLLVDLGGTVKLLDLGLAMFFTEELEGDPLTLRYNENVLGTADYLAPEQAVDSHNIDIRADIYSLGGTLYYLLSGQSPFPAGTIAQKLLWHQQKDPEPITSLVPEVPKSLEAVLRKMMAKKPEQRYATAEDVAAALLPFSKPHPQPFPPEAAKQYETPGSRPSSRSIPPPSAIGKKAQRPGSSVQFPAGVAPGASSRRIPQTAVGGVAQRVANPPTTAPKSQSVAAATQEADGGLDFLRAPAVVKPATKRDLSSAETVATRSPQQATTAPSRAANVVWIGTGAASVAVIGVLVVLSLSKNPSELDRPSTVVTIVPKKQTPTPEQPSGTGVLYVKSGLGHSGPTSLAGALERCGPNRRVVLSVKSAGDWDVSPLVIGEGKFARCENVYVEGERREVTLFSTNPDGPILHIKRVKGFALKNLTIDGNGRSSPLVVVDGDGVFDCRFENVVFQNFKGDAVQFTGAKGKKDSPVSVTECRFHGVGSASQGIAIVASPSNPSPTSHVVLSNNRFIDCGVGVAVRGPMAIVTLRNNIFARGGIGVQFAPGAATALLEEFRVERSTFWKLPTGVQFDDAPVGAGKIAIVDSLFVEVGSPPVVAPPPVAAQIKGSAGTVEIRGLWANATAVPADPTKAVSVGQAPSVGAVEFQEIDPTKPAFLQPKPQSGDAKSRAPTSVGAAPPVSG